MQAAEAGELGAFESGDRPEHPDLLAVLQLGLETDHVVERAERIVLAQLHHRIRLHSEPCGLVRPIGFIGP